MTCLPTARVGLALAASVVIVAAGSATAADGSARAAAAPPPCAPRLLSASLQGSEVAMSHWDYTVRLTNDSTAACTLRGYPVIGAIGGQRGQHAQRLSLAVHGGSTYLHTDPGVHTITLKPFGSARFYIETVGAYQGGAHPYAISRLSIGAVATVGSSGLGLTYSATAPAHAKIPVYVTAFEADS
jgi:hypothetical protein